MAEKKIIAYKWPKSMGACADKLHELKDARLKQQKIVEGIETEEKALKEHIINTLPKGDTGASGKAYKVAVVTKVVPRVTDWLEVYKHIKKTGRFDLLQKRLSDSAIVEIWDSKKKVPGVEEFKATSVSLTKV